MDRPRIAPVRSVAARIRIVAACGRRVIVGPISGDCGRADYRPRCHASSIVGAWMSVPSAMPDRSVDIPDPTNHTDAAVTAAGCKPVDEQRCRAVGSQKIAFETATSKVRCPPSSFGVFKATTAYRLSSARALRWRPAPGPAMSTEGPRRPRSCTCRRFRSCTCRRFQASCFLQVGAQVVELVI